MTMTATPQPTRATPSRSPRAALYGRVSHASKDASQGLRSVDEQEEANLLACAANGWDVAQVYREKDAISASRFTSRARPEWQRLVADLDAGRYDVLVLWEPSRGSRELMAWAALLDACRRHQVLVHIVSHSHTYDLSQARDWRSLAEDGIDSAYESEKSSQRVKRAMNKNAAEGRPHGRVPYGYVRRYGPDRKLIGQEKDPVTAPIVVEIITRLASAEPVSKVTDDLNARGIPSATGKTWSRSVVRRIALNPVYVAERMHNGEPLPGNWPALVDPAVAAAARRVLEDPKRLITRPGRNRYLLSYLATCAVCGAGLSAAPNKASAPVYFCPKAGHVQVGCTWLDDVVTERLLAYLSVPGLRTRLTATDDGAVIEARAQAAALRDRLHHWRMEAARGKVTPETMAEFETEITRLIAEADRAALGSGAPRAMVALAGAADVAEHWATQALGSQREVLRNVLTVSVDRTSVRGPAVQRDYGRVSITWNEPTSD